MADPTDIMIHNFSERLSENVVHFHVMKMIDSLFIWIGKEAEFSSLSVAMCTKYVSVHLAPSPNQIATFNKFFFCQAK